MGRFASQAGIGAPFGFMSTVQARPPVATGADVFLSAWRTGSGESSRLVFQRYDENGTAIDPQPVVFASSPASPAVVWDGTSFIAYWREYVLDEQKSVTFARRIPARGAVTASTVRVTDKDATLYSAAAAGSSDGFFAAWVETSDLNRAIGAYLSKDGKLTGGPAVIAYSPGYRLTVRPDGSRYVVTSYYSLTSEAVASWQVSPAGVAGVPVDSPPVVESASGERLVFASEGTQFVINFYDHAGLHGPPVRTRLVNWNATVLAMLPVGDEWALLTSSNAGQLIQMVRLNHYEVLSATPLMTPIQDQSTYPLAARRILSRPAIHGSTVSFAWIELARLTYQPSGTDFQRVLGSTTVDLQTALASERRVDTMRFRITAGDHRSPSELPPDAIFNGREFVYAWPWYNLAGDGEVRVVNGDGPRETYGPNGTFAAWVEEGNSIQLRGRFFPNGAAAGQAFTIGEGDGSIFLAANANGFLAGWIQPGRSGQGLAIYLRRYDAGGIAIDAQPVRLDYGYYDLPSAIADGDSFVVAWRSYSGGTFAARVPGRGALTIAPVKILDTPAQPHLVRLNGKLVVLWLTELDTRGDLLKGMVLRDTLAVESPVNLWLIFKNGLSYEYFDAAFNGQELMIALGGAWIGDEDSCLRVRRFDSELRPLAEATLLECTDDPFSVVARMIPSVVWDGQQWWATYGNASYSRGGARVWRISGDGKSQEPLLVTGATVLDLSLSRSPLGVNVTYARADENTAATFRAFESPVFLKPPKGRAARH